MRAVNKEVCPGAFVLIERSKERFWCFVLEVSAERIVKAVVDSILKNNPGLLPGMRLDFPLSMILDVIAPEETWEFEHILDVDGVRAANAFWKERKRRGGMAAGVVTD